MLKYKWSTTNDQIQGLLNRQKYDRGETNSKLVLIKTWFWSKIADHKISEFQSKHRIKYEKVKVSAIADASMRLSLDSPLIFSFSLSEAARTSMRAGVALENVWILEIGSGELLTFETQYDIIMILIVNIFLYHRYTYIYLEFYTHWTLTMNAVPTVISVIYSERQICFYTPLLNQAQVQKTNTRPEKYVQRS